MASPSRPLRAGSQAMTRTQGRIGKTKQQAPVRAAEIVREYGPFAGADHIHGVTHDGAACGPPSDPRSSRSIPRAASSRARLTAPATPAPRSTASTSTRSPKHASTKSIPPPATSWRRSRRPVTAVTRASPGRRAACGSDSTAIARSTRSSPRRALGLMFPRPVSPAHPVQHALMVAVAASFLNAAGHRRPQPANRRRTAASPTAAG